MFFKSFFFIIILSLKMIVFNMMDTWSTCNVTIVKTSSMWKKKIYGQIFHQCTDKNLLFSSFKWVPMLVAFSFFCCCLILLWFCTLPALLVFVVLLAVLFSLILLLLVSPFSEIFGFVLFCFVLFFNFDVISQPYFSQPVLCIFGLVLLSLLLIFFILSLFHNLTCFLGMSGR